jgi:hypothetical protein
MFDSSADNWHLLRRCACRRPEADCRRGLLPEGYCRRGLPDSHLPLVQCASLAAFGDLNFIEHLTEVVEREGRRVQVEKGACPPIDEAIYRAHGFAAAKKLQLIGCRSDMGRRDDIRLQFERIPAGFFELNEWGYEWLDPFSICRAGYDGGWFYPAAPRAAIEQLRSNLVSGRGSDEAVAAAVDEYLRSVTAAGRHSNEDAACEYVLNEDRLPKATRERVREAYRVRTGRGVADRGRPKSSTK